MPKIAKQLSALAVAKLAEGFHAVGGVAGLYLKVNESGSRSWVLRAVINGKRHDMGMGAYPLIGLADAREQAQDRRREIARGVDPLRAKHEAQAALKSDLDFKASALAFIKIKEPEWKNAKHGDQWRNTLETYAYPVIGHLAPRAVDTPHLLRILEPIWTTKTETATRVRNRIELVLDWCTVRKAREGANPARWKGHLDKLLPAPTKIRKVKHHEAMPIDRMPEFMQRLKQMPGKGARALEFLIYTVARSGNARGLARAQIDREAMMWTLLDEDMKADRAHRVPLSAAALAIVDAEPALEGVDLVFWSSKNGTLSDATLQAVLERMGETAVPHGFRSTFKDWAAERTDYPNEVSEMALAHAVGDKVEAAYRRGDLFLKRRKIMDDWAAFLGSASGTPAATP